MEAVALFSGVWLGKRLWGLFLPISIIALTDILLGWHALWPFTWGAMLIGSLLGRYVLQPRRWLSVAALGTLQATLFFLLTNFGVWLQGWYGLTLGGLVACYVAAIPFYHYQVLGALTYGTVFWLLETQLLPKLQAHASAAR